MPPFNFKGRPFTRRLSFLILALAALLPCASPVAAEDLQISTTPALFPAFDPAVTDYVVRGPAGRPVVVSVTAPEGARVSVDGGPSRGESFTTAVGLSEGQSFAVTAATPGATPRTYHVRRLPADFPAYTTERLGVPRRSSTSPRPPSHSNRTRPPRTSPSSSTATASPPGGSATPSGLTTSSCWTTAASGGPAPPASRSTGWTGRPPASSTR